MRLEELRTVNECFIKELTERIQSSEGVSELKNAKLLEHQKARENSETVLFKERGNKEALENYLHNLEK